MFEKIVATLPGPTADTRIDVVQVADPGSQPFLEMRHIFDGGELGWCVQKRVSLAPGSVPALRDALNLMDPDAQAPAAPTVRSTHLTLVTDEELAS